jgi:hypothetical protein
MKKTNDTAQRMYSFVQKVAEYIGFREISPTEIIQETLDEMEAFMEDIKDKDK